MIERAAFCRFLELSKKEKINQFSILLIFFPSKDGNIEKQAKVVSRYKEKHRRNILGTASHGTRPFLELMRKTSHTFLEKLRAESLTKLYQDFSRKISRILGALSGLDEFLLNPQLPTHSGTVPKTSWNHSGNIPEHERRTSWTNSGSFPERSLSWKGILSLCVPQFSWFNPRGGFSHEDRGSRRNPLLPPGISSVRQNKALHKSATIPQWEHPGDNWSTPDCVCPSTVDEKL